MAMRGKMRSEGAGRRRIRSKNEDSDVSDDDYNIEDDGEIEDSDEYCSSLAGEELEDNLVTGTRRLKGRNAFPSKSRSRVKKASKERKVSDEEDSDEDFAPDDDDVDEEEGGKNWATGFPKRKRNGVQKIAKKKKPSYTEEFDEDDDNHDDDDDYDGNKDDNDLQKVFLSRKQNGVQKAVKINKPAYMEENDDDYEAEEDAGDDEEDYNGIEDEKDLQMRHPGRKKNRVQKALKKKKASYTEESDDSYKAEDDACDDVEDFNDIEDEKYLQEGCPVRKNKRIQKALKEKMASSTEESDDNYEAEDDECDEDDDCNDNEDEKDLQTGCPDRKQNGVQKALEENKASYTEESDDYYEAEDDECDEDDDNNDNEVEKDLPNGCPSRKQNGVQKVLKKKKASSTEEKDDDWESEDDEGHEDYDYNDNEIEKGLRDGSPNRKQYGVQKALKEKKASCMVENDDDDYKAEDDECNDDDDYDNEEEEELEEEEDDEDFTPNEIDFDDEDEFAVVEKAKKVSRTHSRGRRCSGGRKRRYSKVNSKRKEPAKRCGFQRKLSSGRRKEVEKRKSLANETNERNSGRKRRRLLLDSDSDFADSKPLLLDQEYTISEEEREQVREASKFCGHLDVALRNCSSKKRSEEEENLNQERKQKARKGKDKFERSKIEAANQVCGICFSEEGKRTVRGTLDCCSHYFCFNCIMEWSKVESRCPFCKQRFVTISKLARSDTMFDLRTTVIPIPERDQVYQPSEEELRAYIDPYENVICTECYHGGDDANMLLCDLCDSPAHTYCVGLSEVPEGNWYCEGCRPTALGPSNPQTPNSSRDRRTTNDLSARSSSPSETVREAIDLNRVYEPETPIVEVTGISSSPRPVNGDLRAGSSMPGVGVQTVRERRRRHQQIAHFVGRANANIGLGPEVEWGRTRRLGFQNAIRPETSFYNTFSQGLLHDNFTSHVPSMHLLPGTPNQSMVHRVWGQTLTGVNDSADGSGSLQAGLAEFTGGDAWSFHGNYSMQ